MVFKAGSMTMYYVRVKYKFEGKLLVVLFWR